MNSEEALTPLERELAAATAEEALARRGLLRLLREPFPVDEYEWLPQPVGKDGTRQKCGFCESLGKSAWHKVPAIHVPFIGHAAVTERLNSIDPEWTWRPFATAEDGSPLVRAQGDGTRLVLWIWLRILEVEKIGVGDTAVFDDPDDSPEKRLISDAIRNAAMRFGVASELWWKDPARPTHYVDESGRERQLATAGVAVRDSRSTAASQEPEAKPKPSGEHAMVRIRGGDALGCTKCGYRTKGPDHDAEARRHAQESA